MSVKENPDRKIKCRYSNASRKKEEAIRCLADNWTIDIKKACTDSCVVIWNKTDYLFETEKQLSNASVFKEKLLADLGEKTNSMFRELEQKVVLSKKLKYFTYKCRKS